MQLKRWNQKNGAYAIAVHNPLNKKYFIIKALSIVVTMLKVLPDLYRIFMSDNNKSEYF